MDIGSRAQIAAINIKRFARLGTHNPVVSALIYKLKVLRKRTISGVGLDISSIGRGATGNVKYTR